MGISDEVADYIIGLLNEADGIAEIKRNELAGFLGCVPSQINYVITSRFTPEQGYIVESRRGGGGYIKITRRQLNKSDMVMHIINSVGSDLDLRLARTMLKNILVAGVITSHEADMINAAVSIKMPNKIDEAAMNQIRASIFKNMLITVKG